MRIIGPPPGGGFGARGWERGGEGVWGMGGGFGGGGGATYSPSSMAFRRAFVSAMRSDHEGSAAVVLEGGGEDGGGGVGGGGSEGGGGAEGGGKFSDMIAWKNLAPSVSGCPVSSSTAFP